MARDRKTTARPAATPTAAVVVVGTELTTGLRTDTNGPEIARALENAGYDVRSVTALPDDEHAIAEHLTRTLGALRLVVVTGGLGPTHDDITREAAALALGRSLVRDESLAAALEPVIGRHTAPDAPARVLRQADVIEGARVIMPTIGTAPGQAIEHGPGTLLLLPGPPLEMRPMLEAFLGRRPAAHAAPRILRTTGLPESDVQSLVEGAMGDAPGIGFTILASPGLVDVILLDTGAGERALADLQAGTRHALGAACYATGSRTLAETVIALALDAGLTLGTAESCTGGMVAAALTDVAGASGAVRGGVIAYADAIKGDILGVPAAIVAEHGAVSEPTACAMASGTCDRLGVDVAVSVTGIAGPSGGSEAKPVGTVWFAIAGPDGVSAQVRTFPGDRAGVRVRATVAALDMLRRALVDHADDSAGGGRPGCAPS